MNKPITSFRGEHRWLSNFWPCEVVLYGMTFPSVEHAYQAAKCALPGDRKRFIGITAGEAKRLGRQVEQRSDWNDLKEAIMLGLLKQKFKAGTELAKQLIGTGSRELVEGNAWHDNYWGACACAKCEQVRSLNKLGEMLMRIRMELTK